MTDTKPAARALDAAHEWIGTSAHRHTLLQLELAVFKIAIPIACILLLAFR
jgi:hypothetical protein